ncbi:hypothetical protein ABGB07_28845 [Micromonosporaceae bacterium B7E4]
MKVHEHTTRGGEAAGDTTQVARAVLAPVRMMGAEVYDQAVAYLLDGSSPRVLTTLETQALAGDSAARLDVDARRAVYAAAPPDTLARFGQLLNALAAGGRTSDDAPRWLIRLVHDVAAVLFSADSEASGTPEATARWTPRFVAEVARAGGVPASVAVPTTLVALLHRRTRENEALNRMIATPDGDAYLAEHADLLLAVLKRLTPPGKRLLLECAARNLDTHGRFVAALTNSPDHAVRMAARVLVAQPEDALPEELRNKLDRFRAAAVARGLPAEDVERWLRTARRSATLSPDADGPVVGRFGGPLLLPLDVPVPETSFESMGRQYRFDHQLIATIDLAAIPEGATDLPLPSDGHLLLFAVAELENVLSGSAVYLPAGTPVEERQQNLDYEPYAYDTPEDLDAALRSRGELRLAREASLAPSEKYRDDQYRSALAQAWDEAVAEIWPPAHVPLQIGGNATDHEGWGDPVLGSGRGARRRGEPGPAATGGMGAPRAMGGTPHGHGVLDDPSAGPRGAALRPGPRPDVRQPLTETPR